MKHSSTAQPYVNGHEVGNMDALLYPFQGFCSLLLLLLALPDHILLLQAITFVL